MAFPFSAVSRLPLSRQFSLPARLSAGRRSISVGSPSVLRKAMIKDCRYIENTLKTSEDGSFKRDLDVHRDQSHSMMRIYPCDGTPTSFPQDKRQQISAFHLSHSHTSAAALVWQSVSLRAIRRPLVPPAAGRTPLAVFSHLCQERAAQKVQNQRKSA